MCQPLAADLLAQILQLQQFPDMSVTIQTTLGIKLAHKLASEASQRLEANDNMPAIALLDDAHAVISKLELDADDPSFDDQSSRVQELYKKVGRSQQAACTAAEHCSGLLQTCMHDQPASY